MLNYSVAELRFTYNASIRTWIKLIRSQFKGNHALLGQMYKIIMT